MQLKKRHTLFTCVTCRLRVETSSFTSFNAASTSRRIHAVALVKARKVRVTSPVQCKLTYLQFVGELTGGAIAGCLQLHLLLCAAATTFASDGAGIFANDSSVFVCNFHVLVPAKAGSFACQWRAIMHDLRM